TGEERGDCTVIRVGDAEVFEVPDDSPQAAVDGAFFLDVHAGLPDPPPLVLPQELLVCDHGPPPRCSFPPWILQEQHACRQAVACGSPLEERTGITRRTSPRPPPTRPWRCSPPESPPPAPPPPPR